jgi:branched-chain amino acid transport system permease protein
MIDLLIAALFAASLHFIMGPAGMHSFGHAAYFGLGAYAAALLVRRPGCRWSGAAGRAAGGGLGALVFGWFSVRLSGVYLAMLTLAFAQITWAVVYQWDDFTGGSNGSPACGRRVAGRQARLLLPDAGAGGRLGVLRLRRILFSPFGYAMRAGAIRRCGPMPSASTSSVCSGSAFVVAGLCRPGRRAVCVFQGQHLARRLAVGKSVDGLVMVLLGGVQTLAGPLVGAVTFTWLHDTVARNTDYWRAMLGGIILLLVLLFPQGYCRVRTPDRWRTAARQARRTT